MCITYYNQSYQEDKMKTFSFLVLFTLLSLSLQIMDERSERVGGGGGGPSSSSSSSQLNKTKQFWVRPNFIQCLKDTTAVPTSIINLISTKTYINMTEEYEYVTSGYSQMILNKINARFKFCAIAIEGPPTSERGCSRNYSCGNALGVTECFIKHLSEEQGNDLQIAYDSRKVTTPKGKSGDSEEVVDDTEWKDQIVIHLDNDPGHFVNCLQDNICVYYFGYYLSYYKC